MNLLSLEAEKVFLREDLSSFCFITRITHPTLGRVIMKISGREEREDVMHLVSRLHHHGIVKFFSYFSVVKCCDMEIVRQFLAKHGHDYSIHCDHYNSGAFGWD